MKKSVLDEKKVFDPSPLLGPLSGTYQISGFQGLFGPKNRKIGISRARQDVIMQTDHFLNTETLLRTIEVD